MVANLTANRIILNFEIIKVKLIHFQIDVFLNADFKNNKSFKLLGFKRDRLSLQRNFALENADSIATVVA